MKPKVAPLFLVLLLSPALACAEPFQGGTTRVAVQPVGRDDDEGKAKAWAEALATSL